MKIPIIIVLSALIIASASATKIALNPFETIAINENFVCRDGVTYDSHLVIDLQFNSPGAPVSFMLKDNYSRVMGEVPLHYDKLSVMDKNEFNGKLTGRIMGSPTHYVVKNNANVCTIVNFTLKAMCVEVPHNTITSKIITMLYYVINAFAYVCAYVLYCVFGAVIMVFQNFAK